MRYFLTLMILPFLLSAEPLPRRVVGFWDKLVDFSVEASLVHRTLELPLNYLGLDVVYYDIQKPLPDLNNRNDIVGIVICFRDATKMPNPIAFINWAVDVIDQGKKVIILRNPGFTVDMEGNFTTSTMQNKLYRKLGILNKQEKWIEHPYDYKIITQDKDLASFEMRYPDLLPGFDPTHIYDNSAKSYLTVGIPGEPETNSDLVIVSPNGAFVSPYFANSWDSILYTSNPRSLGWYINPFRLFEIVFELTNNPIPDTTTLAGRRIYHSTIHGDDWSAASSIEEYRRTDISVAEVILEKVIKPNPDLPVTVAVIAADVDPNWVGTAKSQAIARKYFELHQVEAASHTYSHPLDWGFFKNGGPEKEIKYLYRYPYGTWQSSFLSWFRAKSYQIFTPQELAKRELKKGYITPRTYANEPFDIKKEIGGAVEYLNQFAPDFNKPKILIWSGDSLPWGKAVGLAKNGGINNYGGGFVRLDPDYPSILFVYPLGRKPGGYIQLYSASNGENDYTNEWQERFYGYQYLPETLKNLESPRRLKPLLLYYHSYSGQFQTSLNAVLSNIAFVRTQKIISMMTGRYCSIGEGFYSTEFEILDSNRWKIRKRQGLQTIRFDHAENRVVDFSKSEGVIGYTHHEGSLYVYLDAAITEPTLAITEGKVVDVPYLIDSSWEVWNLKRENKSLTLDALGWGKLTMNWKMPVSGAYTVTALGNETEVFTDGDRLLSIELELPYNMQQTLKIEQTSK